jgi:hypothetical protein
MSQQGNQLITRRNEMCHHSNCEGHFGVSYIPGEYGYWEVHYCKSCGLEISRVFIPDKLSE